MVKVPEYAPDVPLRPGFRQDVQSQATPQAFGSDVGAGLQTMARGVEVAAQNVEHVRDLNDTMRAKDADNKYADWLRVRKFGQGGFMTLEGRAAVDAREAFEKEAAEKQREYGQGLTPGAALHYQKAAGARLQSTLGESIVHSAQARKTWFNQASSARVEAFANDALAGYDKPDVVSKSIALGQAEIRQAGAMHGWDADTLKQREAEFVSGVHKNVTLRLAQTDPIAAEKYMIERKGQISGANYYELETSLKSEIKQEKSKRAASEFFSQSAAAGANGSTFDMIARFEGFRSGTYWDVNHHRLGYGSDTITREDGSVVTVQQGMTVSEVDAARDLNRRIAQSQVGIVNTVGRDKFDALSAPAKAAVTSVAYNYGSLPESVASAIKTGGPAEIATAIRGLENHNDGINKGRRNKEADAVLGIKTAAGVAAAGRDAQSFYTDLEGYLAKITDPDVQDMTRKRINAMLETKNKAVTENQRQAKATLWSYIDKGQTPDQVPMEVRQAAGMEAVSSAWSYMDTVRRGRDVQSDEETLYGMRRTAAMDPEFFSRVDLNDYRHKLSRSDIKELSGLQTSALTDQRKAREDGLQLTAAYSQAENQLAAVGITTRGLKGSELEKANRRIAQFNNALSVQMDEFKRSNNDRKPTQLDIQSMINRLLLPVVIKQPGTFWDSTWTPPGASKTFAFDAAQRPDNSVVEGATKYEDIPIDLRRGIALDLERELGRKPTTVEVAHRYQSFVLKQ